MSHNRLISMLIGLGMLSACSGPDERKRAAENDNGADLSVQVGDGDGGGLAMHLPSFRIGTADIDIDGVKLYPGTRVTGIDVSGPEGEGDGGVAIRFDADAAPNVLRDYYLAAFKDKGRPVTADAGGISGRDHGGKAFRIDLAAQGGGTRGTIHMGQKNS